PRAYDQCLPSKPCSRRAFLGEWLASSCRQVHDMAGDILDIDLVSQTFMRDPFPTLARLREAGPVVRVKVPFLGTTWIATSYEAVTTVLKDDGPSGRSPKNAGKKQFAGRRWWMPRTHRVLAENIPSSDAPDPRRLRKLVDQAFNRQSVE